MSQFVGKSVKLHENRPLTTLELAAIANSETSRTVRIKQANGTYIKFDSKTKGQLKAERRKARK